jgi:hypothetical protein
MTFRPAFALLVLLVGCDLVSTKKGEADAAAVASAAAPGADAAAPAAQPVVTNALDASADGAAAKAPPIYAVFAGQTSKKSTFRVAVERTGTDVRAVFDTGAPLLMIGKMSDDTHFSARSAKVAKGEKPATLAGELGATTLKGTFTDPSGKSQSVVSGSADALPGTFDAEYLGTVGKQFVRMKLSRRTGTLTGMYRYAASTSDLQLEGLVHDDGRFELTERTGGHVSGKLVGVLASPAAALGQWQSPDGTRTAPISLERGSGYPETRTYDDGLVLYPQERILEGKRCKTDIVFPQVRGASDKTAMKAVNDFFRGDTGKAKTCDGPDDPTMPDFETSEGYTLDTKKGRFIGVRRSGYAYAGGAHGGGGTLCDVVDTKTVSHFKLAPKLSEPGRAKLSDMVTAELAKQHGVSKLTDAGFFADKVTLTKDSDLCLGESWIEVDFDAYEIGPYALGPQEARFTFAQMKDLFVKDDVTSAIFGEAPPASPSSPAPGTSTVRPH